VQAIVAARDSLLVLQYKDDEKVQLFTDGKKIWEAIQVLHKNQAFTLLNNY